MNLRKQGPSGEGSEGSVDELRCWPHAITSFAP